MVARLSGASHLRVVSDRAPSELNDAALGEALRRREPWATEVVWKRYASLVHGLFGRALGRGADHERLTQDVFVRLLTRVGSLAAPSELRTTVYGHAIAVLRRELRRRKIRHFFARRTPRFPSDDDSGLDRAAALALSRLYEALDQLSANDRAIFTLRELEGLSYGEIAEVLDKSVASVKQSSLRALSRVEGMVRGDPLLRSYAVQSGASEPDRKEGA